MREMSWNQYDDAEFNFYKDIEELDEDFSDVLTAISTVSIRRFFWIEKEYLGTDSVKAVLTFNPTLDIPSNIVFAIGLSFTKNFLEW